MQENKGIILLTVSDNVYFNSSDVKQWISENRLSFQGLTFDGGKVSLTEDESIRIRYEFRFLQGQNTVARRVQIRVDDYQTYFKSHKFYQQKVVNLELGIEQEPVYSEEKVLTGTLTVGLNVDDAEVIAINKEGKEVAKAYTISNIADFLVQFKWPIQKANTDIRVEQKLYHNSGCSLENVREEFIMRTSSSAERLLYKDPNDWKKT